MKKSRRPSSAMALLAALFALQARVAAADSASYAEHLARASQYEQQQRFRDSLNEYEAAYAQVQAPLILLYLGRMHAQLGEGRESLELYRRFLVAMPEAVPEARQEATQQIERLRQLYERQPPRPPQAWGDQSRLYALPAPISQREILRRRYVSLSAGGAVLFTLGYVPALAAGAVFISVGASLRDRQFQIASGMLMIPIVGPFIGGFMEPSTNWTVPWIVFDGVAQVGGLAMMILGGKSKRAMARLAHQAKLAEVQLYPHSAGTTTGFTLAGRF